MPALKRLEERVKNQEFRIEEAHKGAEQVIFRLRELEALLNLFNKKFGEKKSEKIITKYAGTFGRINQCISMNQFAEAELLIKEIARSLNVSYNQANEAYQ